MPGLDKTTPDRIAIIIGAGPAGLTAAYELLRRTRIKPVVFEMSADIGGISKTVNYKGNRLDVGGHRFFSKSDRVMDWWQCMLPVQGAPSKDELDLAISYHRKTRTLRLSPDGPDPETTDETMLVRDRLSRIYFLRHFFNYPISLTAGTVRALGPWRVLKLGLSYIKSRLFPIAEVKSLEDFIINRFGRAFYLTFFKDYTEKVWGVPCREISAEWGAQRIRGLSIGKALMHALRRHRNHGPRDSREKTETTLIEQFLYPKLGPGQMWELVAKHVRAAGGEVHTRHRVASLRTDGDAVVSADIEGPDGRRSTVSGDFFFSTMPVKELIASMSGPVPDEVREVAEGLMYRDFITVGLLLRRLKVKNQTDIPTRNGLIPDTWIYVQERDVKVGRLQIFNNWSPYMVKDRNTVWMGMEYFVSEGDEIWSMPDDEIASLAADELARIEFIDRDDVLDSTVLRMPKAYPAYFGTYDRFDVIRGYVDRFSNLFLLGRNGMHKYNNADHSMLTAMIAVDNIVDNVPKKDNIWAVNTEEEPHE